MSVQSNRSKKLARQCPAVFESLESRQMFANKGNMWDVDLNTHHEAPPAIVEYAQTSNPDSSLPVNPTTDTATESRSLGVYNSTWGGPDFGRSVYWAAAAGWNTSRGLDLSRNQTELLARIARDGGDAINMQRKVASGSMMVLDFEDPRLTHKSPAFVADRLKWFKQAAPDIKVGVFGLTIYPELNSDEAARMSPAAKAYLKRKILEYRAVYENSDFICYDVYMLSPKDVDRDLKCHAEMTAVFRELFPGKPVIPFVWGAYHDTWNPAHSVLSDEVTQLYAQSLARDNDAVMVWGPYEDNAKLIDYLQQADSRVLPSDRTANWANEATVQDPAAMRGVSGSAGSTGSTPTTGPTSNRVIDGLLDDAMGDKTP